MTKVFYPDISSNLRPPTFIKKIMIETEAQAHHMFEVALIPNSHRFDSPPPTKHCQSCKFSPIWNSKSQTNRIYEGQTISSYTEMSMACTQSS